MVKLERLGGGGGGAEPAIDTITRVNHDGGDPAAGNLDDMLIPGTSALLDRILRRQLSLPDRGYFCPYCTREVNMRTLGKHMTKIHGGMRLQCKACRDIVHTRVTSLLINHGVCVLLLNKNSKLGDQLIRKLSRQIRSIYKNRRFKSQMLKRYPDLSYFCSSFIFGRVKQPCEKCGLVLWSSSMASHLEKCGEDVIQCDFCNKHMARTRLPYHIDIYHPGKVISHKPLVTEYPALTAGGSGTASPIAHPVFTADDADGEEEADATPGAQIVSCTKCNKRMRQNNLKRHMRVMHPWKPSMKFDGEVNPATGIAGPAAGEQVDDEPIVLSGDESGGNDEGEEDVGSAEEDATPARKAAPPDDRYAAYKRQCPVCAKVMWKKYLGSHIRSAHPERDDIDDAEIERLTQLKPIMQVSRAKQIKHCPYCWKTMWRCNVKRHIRQVHPEHAHKLTDDFNLQAEIRAAARERGEVPPPSSDVSDDEAEGIDDEDDEGAVVETRDEAMLAIQEMNAMAEAEGLEALEQDDEHAAEQLMKGSEIVSTDSSKHEKNLKRCRICRKLLRGCHLKRHMLNWHSPMATGKVSTKTGVPGGLNPARQRTCPVCLKVVVVNNLRRHIRASHPEVGEEELVGITDVTLSGVSASFSAADDIDESHTFEDSSGMLDVEHEIDEPSSPPSGGATASGGASSSTYAQRRMRRCPYCGKVMVSSNMARHCKTHHPEEWAATHGAREDTSNRAGGGVISRSAAEAALEEMEAMNAEEAAALLDEEGDSGDGDPDTGLISGDEVDLDEAGVDELMDDDEALAEFEDEEENDVLAADMEDDLAERLEIVDDLQPEPDEDRRSADQDPHLEEESAGEAAAGDDVTVLSDEDL